MKPMSWETWQRGVLILASCLAAATAVDVLAADQAPEFPGKQSTWNGYVRYDFEVDEKPALVVAPREAAPGKPWVWHGEFFGHRPEPDIALLGRGFHIVYLKIPDLFGAPQAVEHWNAFYKELTEKHQFAKKAALVGVSRGGLYCYNWAAANPEKIACIYGDAPVCDLKSWPLGKGKGTGNPNEVPKLLAVYGVSTVDELLAKAVSPIDNLEPLAKAKIPLLHVYGDADQGVPWDENTGVVAERYRKLGGDIKLIAKPGVGHVHGLDDSTPIIEFIAKQSLQQAPTAENSKSDKAPTTQQTAVAPRPIVKVVEGGESKIAPADCRVSFVGPGVNQPESYAGYGGFVGWVSPVLLKNGDWLVGFSAGYWHASPSTPLRYSPQTIAEYQKMGMPADVVAPTGGRAMIVRSSDEGKTWSKPVTLLDTPDDDRHPAWVLLPNGTLLCSLFTYPGAEIADIVKQPENAYRTVIIRSSDGGQTWDKKLIRPPSPFLADESNGPMVVLKDGSVLLTISGVMKPGAPAQAAVFCSDDSGATWRHLSTIKADHDLDEANATQLPDGRLVLMARPEGDISWSRDQGRTWTAPQTFGMRLFAPSLYALADGALVCLHGSYAPGHGGMRLIFSTDGGQTWIAPAKDHGFLVDDCYGYGKAIQLSDGSLLVTDQGTGGHSTADAKNMSLRWLRLRIRADHSGIDLLPAPKR
jgi:pimeloyl-ACP methyl ester carboxylesterase/photosystem II stability/assembly factor-like uncharacterized protein